MPGMLAHRAAESLGPQRCPGVGQNRSQPWPKPFGPSDWRGQRRSGSCQEFSRRDAGLHPRQGRPFPPSASGPCRAAARRRGSRSVSVHLCQTGKVDHDAVGGKVDTRQILPGDAKTAQRDIANLSAEIQPLNGVSVQEFPQQSESCFPSNWRARPLPWGARPLLRDICSHKMGKRKSSSFSVPKYPRRRHPPFNKRAVACVPVVGWGP
jgi:hypothetical protein